MIIAGIFKDWGAFGDFFAINLNFTASYYIMQFFINLEVIKKI